MFHFTQCIIHFMKTDSRLQLPLNSQLALDGQTSRTHTCVTVGQSVDASFFFLLFSPQTHEWNSICVYLMFLIVSLSVQVIFALSRAESVLPPPPGQLHVSICH